jgi:erythromycin esterase
MKPLVASALSLLLAAAGHAAPDPIALQATPVRIASAPGDDFADLAPFGRAIAGARVVALDEQTHGGREEFLLKTRLLRYLHEKRGFDVLVLESGFFDVGRIEQKRQAGERVDDLGPGNIFYMYSKTAEGRELLRYIDATRATAHPLTLVGMDSQLSGALSQQALVPELGRFLATHGSHAPESRDWSGFAGTVAALTAMRATPTSPADRAAFDRMGAQLARELAALGDAPRAGVGSAGWWGRVVAGLRAQETQRWVAPRGNARDLAMGDNVAWIADRLVPGQRLVVWGHAIHLMHDAPSPDAPPLAGTVMRRHFGAGYHVAHLTGLAGRYLDYTTLQPHDIPAAAPDSLEARLATHPGAAQYLAPPRQPVADAPPARDIDYQPFGPLPGRGLHWESTFFIRAITPVTMVR